MDNDPRDMIEPHVRELLSDDRQDVDAMALLSIAVSLKRIADSLCKPPMLMGVDLSAEEVAKLQPGKITYVPIRP